MSDGILELRHYTAADGRGDAVLRRLEEHTFPICASLGMRLLGYGQEPDDPDQVHYVLAWDDVDQMLAGWKTFVADPRWQAVVAETDADGPLVVTIKRTVLKDTR
jgi:hypothetical protein